MSTSHTVGYAFAYYAWARHTHHVGPASRGLTFFIYFDEMQHHRSDEQVSK